MSLDYILDNLIAGGSIKEYIDGISEMIQELSDEQRLLYSNKIKSVVQKEAENSWIHSNRWGCIYMATGTGKSRIAISICNKLVQWVNGHIQNGLAKLPKILLVVPTEKLRDENWHDEFKKWHSEGVYNIIERCCYASLNKYEGQDFDLVILDKPLSN